MINVGDRVTWQHRTACSLQDRPGRKHVDRVYPGKLLTGIVRLIQYHDGIKYAVVATDPDERLTMPSLDKLQKVGTPS